VRREIATETFLARLPLFAGLAAEPLARLAAATTRRRLARGEALFRQGEPSTGLHAVLYGSIKLSMRAARGERVVDIVGPGQSFGEPVMFLEKPYIVSATALADSLVLQVDREAVFAELERSPQLARRVIAALSQRIEGLVREVETYALGSAGERLPPGRLPRGHRDAARGEAPARLAAQPERRAFLARAARARRARADRGALAQAAHPRSRAAAGLERAALSARRRRRSRTGRSSRE
jgi:CRP-like cAMP-binding protein